MRIIIPATHQVLSAPSRSYLTLLVMVVKSINSNQCATSHTIHQRVAVIWCRAFLPLKFVVVDQIWSFVCFNGCFSSRSMSLSARSSCPSNMKRFIIRDVIFLIALKCLELPASTAWCVSCLGTAKLALRYFPAVAMLMVYRWLHNYFGQDLFTYSLVTRGLDH